jgi:hypothetical protein
MSNRQLNFLGNRAFLITFCGKILNNFVEKKLHLSWVLVAHACNPSYSRDRDQKDQGSKPAWTNSLRDPSLKKTTIKNRAGRVIQGVGPEFIL